MIVQAKHPSDGRWCILSMAVQKTSVRWQVVHFEHGSSENIRQMAGGAFLRTVVQKTSAKCQAVHFAHVYRSENICQMSGCAFCAW